MKQLVYTANCCFNSCAEQSHKDNVRKATVEEQLKQIIFELSMRAQLHLPALDLSWTGKRLSNCLWKPSSTSLLLISPLSWFRMGSIMVYWTGPSFCTRRLSPVWYSLYCARKHMGNFSIKITVSASLDSIEMKTKSITRAHTSGKMICRSVGRMPCSVWQIALLQSVVFFPKIYKSSCPKS